MKKYFLVFSFSLLASCSHAGEMSITIPDSDTQRLVSINLSMTTESLLKAYLSPNIEQRRLAESYVLGVIDSTEGSLWCGYHVASPDAIQEQIYLGLKEVVASSPTERASTAIILKLKQLLPCKGEK